MTEFQMSVGGLYTSAIFPTFFLTVLLSLFTCIVIIVKHSIFLFPFPSLLTHPLSFLSLPLLPSPSISHSLPPSPPTPGTSGFFRRTGLPAGDHVLRVVAVDPVRNERAVIRNRLRVRRDSRFCIVVGINGQAMVGRNNNMTVEFTGTGLTTGFQCLMDRQQPYFNCKWL